MPLLLPACFSSERAHSNVFVVTFTYRSSKFVCLCFDCVISTTAKYHKGETPGTLRGLAAYFQWWYPRHVAPVSPHTGTFTSTDRHFLLMVSLRRHARSKPAPNLVSSAQPRPHQWFQSDTHTRS